MAEYLRSKLNDSINIDSSKHKFYEELRSENMPFNTMKDIFLAAAYFGYKKKKREPIKAKQKIFTKMTFKDEEMVDIFALAIATEKNVDVLSQDDALEIVEQLANGGIEELRDLVASFDDPFIELIEHLVVFGEVV